jgi:hypothetical protein
VLASYGLGEDLNEGKAFRLRCLPEEFLELVHHDQQPIGSSGAGEDFFDHALQPHLLRGELVSKSLTQRKPFDGIGFRLKEWDERCGEPVERTRAWGKHHRVPRCGWRPMSPQKWNKPGLDQ